MTPSELELDRAIAEQIKGVAISAEAIRSHVIRPSHLEGASSDHGAEGTARFVRPPLPIGLPYYLDVYAFGAALAAALENSVAGYVVQLRQNGVAILTQDWQFAKRPQDGGANWTQETPMHVASVSKLTTAMAMTVLLSDHGISPDAPIIDYLPDYWAKGPNIEYIVFRNLFNHTSGLSAPDVVDLTIMQNAIAEGISLNPAADSHLGLYSYQNLNYALCRILLAVINGNISKSAVFLWDFFPDLNNRVWDKVTIDSYAQYVQARVFQPSGVTAATLDHPADAALGYVGPGDAAHGWNSGNLEEICGGDAWHLSANDLLDVMGQFRRGGGIMPSAAAQAMLENMFGVDPYMTAAQVGYQTPAGVVYLKPGDWYQNGNMGPSEHSIVYFLPQDMELVLLANSSITSPSGATPRLVEVVTQAYLDNLTNELPVHL
jgi:CubicO group peptidase (beta-lactamase class C family)